MSEFPWRKLYLDEFCAETKFLRIADMTGALPGTVQGCFLAAMRQASKNHDGSLAGLDLDELAWYQRIPETLVDAVFAAFRKLKIIVGDAIANWVKRQVAAVRATSTERVRKHRKQKRRFDHRQGNLLLPISGRVKRTQALDKTTETPDETHETPDLDKEEEVRVFPSEIPLTKEACARTRTNDSALRPVIAAHSDEPLVPLGKELKAALARLGDAIDGHPHESPAAEPDMDQATIDRLAAEFAGQLGCDLNDLAVEPGSCLPKKYFPILTTATHWRPASELIRPASACSTPTSAANTSPMTTLGGDAGERAAA